MAPYPTSSTVLSASAGCQPGFHSCRSWARTNAGTPRSDDRISVSASSAVEVSWMPRPLHSVDAVGDRGRMLSTPAVSVCTSRSEVICGITSATAGPTAYGGT